MKKIKTLFSLLFVSSLYFAQTLPTTENYIQSRVYLEAVTTTNTTAKQAQTVQYFDGLGRPKQVVSVKASPTQKDVVTHIEYDQFGRQTKDYLPVPQSGTQNGAIYATPLANASSIYGNEKIFSEKILENSPLDRILQQKQVGNDWQTKPVNFGYDANVNGEVRKYTTTTTWSNGATTSILTLSGNYAANQLYKNTVTDEDGNTSIEFKNGQGQTLLVRKNDGSQNVDTYYVYNEYDQLAFVISPLAAVNTTIDQTILDQLCYQYRYDGRNRLVEKKLPGKGWEYMVYDGQDRLILTRDANLLALGQWLFTKYDMFGRVVYTGITTAGARNSVQTTVNGFTGLAASNNVSRTTAVGFSNSGMSVYYDNDGTKNYPTTITKLLSVNYYDTYPIGTPTIPSSIIGQTVLTQNAQNSNFSTKSLPTASYVKNIEDDSWTKNYTWYDTKARPIGSHSINYLGGYTKTEAELDFAGVAKQTKTYHKRTSSATETVIVEEFTYDSQNRLLIHKHKVNNQPQEILSQNVYNELSELKTKKVGGVIANSPLQTIDFAYNIRGWMTKINDPANLSGKLFGYEIKYQNPTNTSVSPAKYNGNIAEIDWATSNDGVLRRYGYQYDSLNRLLKGIYQTPTSYLPKNNFYDEELNYDLNGNIQKLKRFSFTIGTGTTASKIDDLNYVYTGNQLKSVTDTSQDYRGYPDVSGNPISYDANGNMINHLDKSILQIDYNHLNLPKYVKFNDYIVQRSGFKYVNTTYLYRADGIKLKKIYTDKDPHSTISLATKTNDYLDGFQYESFVSGTLNYSNVLKFVPTSEGYFNFENNSYIYNYTDHLGNVRLSFYKNSANALEIVEENNYYPFGLKHQGYNELTGNPSYKYKYNGKELQETGMYDYGWRNYAPDLGRWITVDPLAEMYPSWSPYVYTLNNPIKFIDPDGRWVPGAGLWNNLTKSDARIHAEQWAEKISDPHTGFYNVSVNKGSKGTWSVSSHTLDASYKDTFNSKGYQNSLVIPYSEGGGLGTAPSSGDPWGPTVSNMPDSYGKTDLQMMVSENPLVQSAVIGAVTGGVGNLMRSAGAADAVSAEGAVWAQKTFSNTFGNTGAFAGQTVDDVAAALRGGSMSAADVPINVVVRDGQTFILNTRSSAALMRAGIPRSAWNVVNQTGVSSFEGMLNGQLLRNGLINGTNTIRQSGTQLILSH